MSNVFIMRKITIRDTFKYLIIQYYSLSSWLLNPNLSKEKWINLYVRLIMIRKNPLHICFYLYTWFLFYTYINNISPIISYWNYKTILHACILMQIAHIKNFQVANRQPFPCLLFLKLFSSLLIYLFFFSFYSVTFY